MLISLGLLFHEQSDLRNNNPVIQCKVDSKSRVCKEQIQVLIKSISPEQSLVILCKAFRALGSPCIKTTRNATSSDKSKGLVLPDNTSGADPRSITPIIPHNVIPPADLAPNQPNGPNDGTGSTNPPSNTNPPNDGGSTGTTTTPSTETPQQPDCIINANGLCVGSGVNLPDVGVDLPNGGSIHVGDK